MADTRGRRSVGGFLGDVWQPSGTASVTGQPVMVRMQGVPTMPGYRDRIGKWNFRRTIQRLKKQLVGI